MKQPLTIYDSGSALFRQIGSEWFLVGLGAYVQNSGYSLGEHPVQLSKDSDDSYFIRISSYSSAVDQIGAVAVPEPSSSHYFVGGLLFLGFLAIRKILPQKS